MLLDLDRLEYQVVLALKVPLDFRDQQVQQDLTGQPDLKVLLVIVVLQALPDQAVHQDQLD